MAALLRVDPQTISRRERGEMVDLVYEEREWICVFCKEPQRYTLINGYCEIGCGAAWTMRDGRSVNSCFKPECQAATERFLSLPNYGNEPQPQKTNQL